MIITYSLLALLIVNAVVGTIYLGTILADIRTSTQKTHALQSGEEYADMYESFYDGQDSEVDYVDETSGVSEHVAVREEAFDERIARLIDNLDEQDARAGRKGEVAEELHKDVQNLPHDSIKHINSNPPEEYSI